MRSGPSLQLKVAGVCFAAGALILISTLVRSGRNTPAPAPDPTAPARVTATAELAEPVEQLATNRPAPTAAAIRAGVPPLDKDNCPPDYPVKGNIGDNGKIYHVKGSQSYARTDPEICFASAADAIADGFSRPQN